MKPINLLARKFKKLEREHGYVSTSMLTKFEREHIEKTMTADAQKDIEKIWEKEPDVKVNVAVTLPAPSVNQIEVDIADIFDPKRGSNFGQKDDDKS